MKSFDIVLASLKEYEATRRHGANKKRGSRSRSPTNNNSASGTGKRKHYRSSSEESGEVKNKRKKHEWQKEHAI